MSTELDIAALAAGYHDRSHTVMDVVDEVLARINGAGDDHVWISRTPEPLLRARARELQGVLDSGYDTPLSPVFGVPFAVKDAIDVAGLFTTVACPAFSYDPPRSATIVERLLKAGAICVGKTNLDQFASGLVGVRSPYGISRNPFNDKFIPGGSSSGSAVAVSSGLVSFSLGTDAAGSGRVPAALTNIVGLKPTRGLVSTDGCVPACRSIDCPSIFASSVGEAWQVLNVVAGFDEQHPYSREDYRLRPTFEVGGRFRFGVPAPADSELFFDGDPEAERLFWEAVAALESLNGIRVNVDFAPFRETAALLYEGPWIADRMAPLESFLNEHSADVLPVTRNILEGGKNYSAVQAFTGLHELQVLKRAANRALRSVDAMLVPTTPTTYTIDEVLAEPYELNRRLGYYTNFVNLLDLSALAVPNGFRKDGLPMGVTFIAPAFHDATLAVLGQEFHKARGGTAGAMNRAISEISIFGHHTDAPSPINLAVVGAHLSGEVMNSQLLTLGATLVRRIRTAPQYRLIALRDVDPPRPGLVRVGTKNGAAIEAEVWSIPADRWGRLIAQIPSPLTIGTVALEDGTSMKGFLCEQYAANGGDDITRYGGWREYASHLSASVT